MAGSPKKPKAPPPPAPPPTQTTQDVQQEATAEKKKALQRSGAKSTILTQQVNSGSIPAGQNTLLG